MLESSSCVDFAYFSQVVRLAFFPTVNRESVVGTRRIFHVDPDKVVQLLRLLDDLPDVPVTLLLLDPQPQLSQLQGEIRIQLLRIDRFQNPETLVLGLGRLLQSRDVFSENVHRRTAPQIVE